jgi:hypothetical protein
MYQERKRWLQECRIAAHVRCDDAPAETRKRHQLVAPGDAAFGKSVQQKRGVVAKEPAHAARLRIHTPAILCYLRVSRPVAQQDRAAVFWRIGCPIRTRRAAPQRNVGSMMRHRGGERAFPVAGSGNVPSGGSLTVAAADLGSVWVGGATAPEPSISGRAFDGTDSSIWRPFGSPILSRDQPGGRAIWSSAS